MLDMNKLKRVVIELSEETGEFKYSLPDNIALTLGMLRMTEELVISQHLRNPQQVPRVIDVAGAIPPIAKQ